MLNLPMIWHDLPKYIVYWYLGAIGAVFFFILFFFLLLEFRCH